jgi:hypothetical protein
LVGVVLLVAGCAIQKTEGVDDLLAPRLLAAGRGRRQRVFEPVNGGEGAILVGATNIQAGALRGAERVALSVAVTRGLGHVAAFLLSSPRIGPAWLATGSARGDRRAGRCRRPKERPRTPALAS